MFEIISSLLKYIFITLIYLFIFGIIRLVYLDIRSTDRLRGAKVDSVPYLKLVNRREALDFKVSENYPVERDACIGRKAGNDVVIGDPYLSGLHAKLTMADGAYMLKDLGSTNGTFINGARLEKEAVCLRDGDRIHMGQVDFLFVNKGGGVGKR